MKERNGQLRYLSIVIGAFLSVGVIVGLTNNLYSLYVIPITTGLGISRGLYSMGITVRYIASAFCNLFMGRLYQRFGYRRPTVLLVLLVVAFMVRGSLREPEKIVLPPEPSTTEPSGPTVDNEAVDRVEVRPDTVQSAIEVLARPRVYTRTITVERYWSGGSGVSVITAAAADGWLRLDVTETDGQTRHVITGDDAVYIWYGSSRKVYSGASALTQDAEQGILTYEDILALPPERIAAADYRALEGVNCIYVETEPDEAGYVERYWVSVSSGLLAAAERECDGAVVYRMAALTVSYDGVDAEDFTLPDGTVLYEPVTAAQTTKQSEND